MGVGSKLSSRVVRVGMSGLAVAALAACASAAASEPPDTVASTDPPPTTEPVSVTELAAGEYDEPIEIAVEGDESVQVVFRETVLPPGARTGEHCHHGQLVAVVKQGDLTHYAPVYPGGVHVYQEGDAVIEGSDYVHEGVNEGDEDVVLWVTYLIEDGEPLADTDLTRCGH